MPAQGINYVKDRAFSNTISIRSLSFPPGTFQVHCSPNLSPSVHRRSLRPGEWPPRSPSQLQSGLGPGLRTPCSVSWPMAPTLGEACASCFIKPPGSGDVQEGWGGGSRPCSDIQAPWAPPEAGSTFSALPCQRASCLSCVS